jgi:hypothetical protein
MPAARLTPHAEREVAVRAGCDPRTVRAFIEGRQQHSTTAARIARAIEELGLKVGESRP